VFDTGTQSEHFIVAYT